MARMLERLLSIFTVKQNNTLISPPQTEDTVLPLNFVEDSESLADLEISSANIYESVVHSDYTGEENIYHKALYTGETSLYPTSDDLSKDHGVETLITLPTIEGIDKADIMFDMLMSDVGV